MSEESRSELASPAEASALSQKLRKMAHRFDNLQCEESLGDDYVKALAVRASRLAKEFHSGWLHMHEGHRTTTNLPWPGTADVKGTTDDDWLRSWHAFCYELKLLRPDVWNVEPGLLKRTLDDSGPIGVLYPVELHWRERAHDYAGVCHFLADECEKIAAATWSQFEKTARLRVAQSGGGFAVAIVAAASCWDEMLCHDSESDTNEDFGNALAGFFEWYWLAAKHWNQQVRHEWPTVGSVTVGHYTEPNAATAALSMFDDIQQMLFDGPMATTQLWKNSVVDRRLVRQFKERLKQCAETLGVGVKPTDGRALYKKVQTEIARESAMLSGSKQGELEPVANSDPAEPPQTIDRFLKACRDWKYLRPIPHNPRPINFEMDVRIRQSIRSLAPEVAKLCIQTNEDPKPVFALASSPNETLWSHWPAVYATLETVKARLLHGNEALTGANQPISSTCPPEPPTLGELNQKIMQLPKRYRLAYIAYKYAESRLGPEPSYPDAWNFLAETGPEEIDGLGSYDLPDCGTFQDYCSAANNKLGCPKNQPRHGRTGRSVVKQPDL